VETAGDRIRPRDCVIGSSRPEVASTWVRDGPTAGRPLSA